MENLENTTEEIFVDGRLSDEAVDAEILSFKASLARMSRGEEDLFDSYPKLH